MAKVDINTVSTPFRGKVGLVVFRSVQGRLQVAAPQMFSSVSNGAFSRTNCAREIAGP